MNKTKYYINFLLIFRMAYRIMNTCSDSVFGTNQNDQQLKDYKEKEENGDGALLTILMPPLHSFRGSIWRISNLHSI